MAGINIQNNQPVLWINEYYLHFEIQTLAKKVPPIQTWSTNRVTNKCRTVYQTCSVEIVDYGISVTVMILMLCYLMSFRGILVY